MLDAAREAVPMQDGKVAAGHALAICACVTLEVAPKWLIYDGADGGLMWHRVPDGVEPFDLVSARFTAGGHADPEEVLRWLRGEVSDPWGRVGDGGGSPRALEALRKRINPEWP
jgi:hypothetical protein